MVWCFYLSLVRCWHSLHHLQAIVELQLRIAAQNHSSESQLRAQKGAAFNHSAIPIKWSRVVLVEVEISLYVSVSVDICLYMSIPPHTLYSNLLP